MATGDSPLIMAHNGIDDGHPNAEGELVETIDTTVPQTSQRTKPTTTTNDIRPALGTGIVGVVVIVLAVVVATVLIKRSRSHSK